MRAQDVKKYNLSGKQIAWFITLAVLGAISLAVSFFLWTDHAWANVLLISYYLLGLGLGGLLFVAFHYLTGAAWSTVLRRIPEAMWVGIPAAAVGLILIFVFKSSLFPWMDGYGLENGEGAFWFKALWLQPLFFYIRAAVYFIIWLGSGYLILRQSKFQDKDGKPSRRKWATRFSALFVVFFGVTFWFASFDWVMSLDPHWFSTIFGFYNFAGVFLGGLAAISLFAVWLRQASVLRGVVTDEHLHDLGKLLFGFSCFWMYIWFSQYMLIWYANIPEETSYFVTRMNGYWEPIFIVNLVLNWVIPFIILMPRAAKKNSAVLGTVAIFILAGRWVDLYLMFIPQISGKYPPFDFAEVGSILLISGIFGFLFFLSFRRSFPFPVNDSSLKESLEHHV
ncbi:MAG: hypothetical protein GY771_06050 [bacterium]|nr:hypothetical protein [bacterium]